MPVQYELLSAARINGIMQGLQDPRLLPQQLVWSRRIPKVPATDEEILARFIGTVHISDIIADDAQAVVYSQGKFQYEATKIPNIKHGVAMSQSMLNQLQRLQQNFAGGGDMGMFNAWEARTLENITLGLNQRIESLLIGMLLDNYDYDRLGIKLSGVTWGMPSDLKVTVNNAWTNPSTATPLSDIQTLRRTARIRYGINFDRITMSTPAFTYMVATDEFKNQAKLFGYGLAGQPTPAIPLQSDDALRQLAQMLLSPSGGVTIELYDARYWSQDDRGEITSHNFMPINKVLLTDSSNDGDSRVWDFANGIVTESIVSNLAPMNINGRLPLGPGPVAYATAPSDLNSPNITYWGVARGFPRKHMLQASAVLTVGTFDDPVSIGVPFPS